MSRFNMQHMQAGVAGVSVIGAGMESWEEARQVLSGAATRQDREIPLPAPRALAANERRRVSPLVRMALHAAAVACADAGMAGDAPDCVFCCALGDGVVTHALLRSLATTERAVSPTYFHNSVHNAMAGYWSIASGNRAAATSLAGGDATFGAGLLKALMTAALDNRPVMLIAAEYLFPGPLGALRPIGPPFAVGLVLVPAAADASGPAIRLTGSCAGPATPPRLDAVRDLWRISPSAKALPLLEGLLAPVEIIVEAGPGFHLSLQVSP